MHFKRQNSQTNAASATLYPPMNLRTHLKTHSGKKLNKCNMCDYEYIQAGNLRTHLKVHSANANANAADVILHLSRQTIEGVI